MRLPLRKRKATEEEGAELAEEAIMCPCGSSDVLPGSWEPCQHHHCENCIWDHLESTLSFICPTCGVRYEGDEPFVYDEVALFSHISPLELKQQSLDLFNKLSDDVESFRKKRKKAQRMRFRALPLFQLNFAYLGITKEKRWEAFATAVLDPAKLPRVYALWTEGLDVDIRNIYGQTALFLAALSNSVSIVKFLLRVGASPTILTNQKTSAFQVASLHGFEEITRMLQPFEAAPPRPLLCVNNDDADGGKLRCDELLSPDLDHPGKASYVIDGGFSETFLSALDDLFAGLPVAQREKESCNDRKYFCDSERWVRVAIKEVMERASCEYPALAAHTSAYIHMRFLYYEEIGGSLPPHIDLTRTDAEGVVSTYTFILYLQDIEEGGETALLSSLKDPSPLKVVKPKRGRLLVFPHVCPHEGRAVVEVPKVLLRGELY